MRFEMHNRSHYYAQSHTALYPFSANQSAPAWERAQILRGGTPASYGADNAPRRVKLPLDGWCFSLRLLSQGDVNAPHRLLASCFSRWTFSRTGLRQSSDLSEVQIRGFPNSRTSDDSQRLRCTRMHSHAFQHPRVRVFARTRRLCSEGPMLSLQQAHAVRLEASDR